MRWRIWTVYLDHPQPIGVVTVTNWLPEEPAELTDPEHELPLHPRYPCLWSDVKPSEPAHSTGVVPHMMPVKPLESNAQCCLLFPEEPALPDSGVLSASSLSLLLQILGRVTGRYLLELYLTCAQHVPDQ